ncbi:MAG TPA: Gfo/Idh/MocA family oxidoreductase [Ktedonosporobacter sp.]|jgi:predicted dehydrogenase|nr:Gfo/Idh/MocA family oxidoreductase [Ktedonosporobacter sp.]
MVLKVAVIGLGKQATEDHLPILALSEHYQLSAVVDINRERLDQIAHQYAVPGFSSVEELLSHQTIDVALMALPHSAYLSAISLVAAQGIHVIKEKPFAMNMHEARHLQELIEKHHIYIGVTMQRRFDPIFQAYHQIKRHIGKIFSIEGYYTMNIASLDQGWRATKSDAGGGALIDMGYHFIDLLVWYFGTPSSVTARLSRGNRPGQRYDVEDTAHLLFDYHLEGYSEEEKTIGTFVISRVYPQKQESLTIYGTQGIIKIKRGSIQRLDCQGQEIEHLERHGRWLSSAIAQFESFALQIQQFRSGQPPTAHEHLAHMAIIEAAYKSDQLGRSCSPHLYSEHLSTKLLVKGAL